MIQTRIFLERTDPDENAIVGAFVSWRIFRRHDAFSCFSSMAVMSDGNLIGGVIFHNYDTESGVIEMSAAGDHGRWMTRRVINDAMAFIFDALKCQMAIGRSASNNPAALAMDRRVFSDEVVVPRLMGRNVDGHLFSITDDQWKASRLYNPRKSG